MRYPRCATPSMLFNSIEFAVFLPIVFLLYWFVFDYALRRCKHQLFLQNLFIVVASYIFYGWWNWRFLILIAFTTLCSFLSGIGIERAQSPRMRKAVMTVNIIINLAILGTYKYYDFFVRSFAELFGCQADSLLLHLVLPVGISFYTFQALSYSIDVYRRQIQPTHDLVAFTAFLSFFPQLVAGPIERATNLLPQFLQKRHFDYTQAVDGMRQILWGLFKKIVVADNCATYVDTVFADYAAYSGSTLLLAAVLFSIQIYGDFSGYSDIAIGTAKLFGIKLMRNFNVPYFSRDIAEFWRRWHISLTTWFRDYVYIPLGGKKKHQLLNMAVVWALTGLWHGASWNFVLWGLYFFVILAAEKTIGEKRLRRIPTILRRVGTMLLVILGWNIFYFTDLTQLLQHFGLLFGLLGAGFSNAQTGIQLVNNLPLLLVCAIGATSVPQNLGNLFGGVCVQGGKRSGQIVYACVTFAFDAALLALSTIALVGSTYNAFLYFRF